MNKDFLLKYLSTDSPSTFEKEGQKVWLDELRNLVDETIIDNYGNVVLLIKGTKSDYKVVLDAHSDEIGWVVQSITDDGLLKVSRNGGTDNDITQGISVKVLTDKGKVKGFFGSTPIHLKDSTEAKKIKQEDLYIDVFATTKDEVKELGIEVGNFIVVDRTAEIINDKFVVGKSLDDKIGGFIHSELIKELVKQKIKLPYDLYIVNSVQEEIGLRGARMITDNIKPDVAICFDVTFDTNTPGIDKGKHGDYKMGDGVIFRQGYDVHNSLLKLMKETANENDIKFKIQVGGSGGTNTASYNISNGGVIASTLSIPLRYMHTQNETVLLEDIQTAVNFYVLLLQKIQNNHNFKYF